MEFWDGGWRLQLSETVVGWANQATRGAKGSGSDVGLWWLRLGGMMVACGDVMQGRRSVQHHG